MIDSIDLVRIEVQERMKWVPPGVNIRGNKENMPATLASMNVLK